MTFNTFYDKDEDVIFLFGAFYGEVIFDEDTLISTGHSDMFIAKLNTNGDFLQIIQTGGNHQDGILCLAKDNEGNIIIGGYYYETTIIGDSIFNSPVGYGKEAFTAKLDSDLNFIWVINGTGLNTDKVSNCITDEESNIYITGYTFEGITFDTIVLNEPYKYNYFAKISKDGKYLWAKQYGGDNEYCEIYVVDLVLGYNGNFIVAGSFREKIIIGNEIFLCDGLYDIYLFSFNADGNYLWAKRYGGDGEDISEVLYIDENNNIYFSGIFMGEIDLGATNLVGTGLLDMFISELDENGNFKWAYRIGGTDINYSRVFCNSLFKTNSMLYIGGGFEKDVMLGENHFFSETNFDGYVARFKLLSTGIDIKPGSEKSITTFPNPATENITIGYQLTVPGNVAMYLYDNYGNELKFFNNCRYSSGKHQYKLNISEYSSGIYFIRIVSGTNTFTKKFIVTN